MGQLGGNSVLVEITHINTLKGGFPLGVLTQQTHKPARKSSPKRHSSHRWHPSFDFPILGTLEIIKIEEYLLKLSHLKGTSKIEDSLPVSSQRNYSL